MSDMQNDDPWDSGEAAIVEEKDLGLVILRLTGALFAIPVTSVVEVVEPKTVTRLFKMPSHIRGVMNLRGRVIPVADLGLLLGIVAENPVSGVLLRSDIGDALFLVDEVKNVVWCDSKSVLEVPSTTSEILRPYVSGVVRLERPVTVLNIEPLFAASCWAAL